MKNKLLVILSILVFSMEIAHALQLSSTSCNSSGNIKVTVRASKWDAIYHEHIIFKGYSYTSNQWKTVVKPLNNGQHRYSVDMMLEAELVDMDSFKISTKRAAIIVGRCV